MNRNILLIQTTDEAGLVYKITNILFHQQLNIIENDEFVDTENNRFFFRCEVEGEADTYVLTESLKKILPLGSQIKFVPHNKKKIVVMATKEHHCLADILVKNHFGDSNTELLAVVSNHEYLRQLTEKFNIPYLCIESEGKERLGHEKEVLHALGKYEPDYIVLAKYMRILSPEFVAMYPYKLINIHHSFLPAFIGANPYKQAFCRGVKIIGATAHFVNNDLDEGPIIAQSVISVNHTYDAREMAKAGKEVEVSVLHQALQLVFNERVMINGNKTIVF